MKLHRRKGRNIVVMPDGQTAERGGKANEQLVEAVAKAYRWQEHLESGEYAEITDLAAALGLDRSYVGRMLQLTSLVPDIVQAILAGEEPSGLSLTKLHVGMSERWDEQRREWARQ